MPDAQAPNLDRGWVVAVHFASSVLHVMTSGIVFAPPSPGFSIRPIAFAVAPSCVRSPYNLSASSSTRPASPRLVSPRNPEAVTLVGNKTPAIDPAHTTLSYRHRPSPFTALRCRAAPSPLCLSSLYVPLARPALPTHPQTSLYLRPLPSSHPVDCPRHSRHRID